MTTLLRLHSPCSSPLLRSSPSRPSLGFIRVSSPSSALSEPDNGFPKHFFHLRRCFCPHPIPSPLTKLRFQRSGVVRSIVADGNALQELEEDLGPEGDVFRKTLRLVECAMLASVAGLTYILSNTLAIENYFGCFFSLPIVISSMRWGLPAGRKTMVATAMLLLTLAGPVKATTYLLMHGFVGLAMGSLWRLRVNWGISIFLCTFIRTLGAVGYVLVSSFLIRENILYLIAVNIHASLMNQFTSLGLNTIISMGTIYSIFGSLLLLNCGSFVLLLHILYAVFFTKLGMKDSLTLPRWLDSNLTRT